MTTVTRRALWLFGGMAAFGAILTAADVAVGIATRRDVRSLFYGGALLVIGLLGLAAILLGMKNSRLLVGENTFGLQDLFGRRRIWTASEVGAVVDAAVVFNKSTPARRTIYVLGLDGRRLMAVYRMTWDSTAIDKLVRATGKPLDVRPGQMSIADFKRDFPSSMGWISTHSMLTGTLLAIGLGAIGVIAIYVVYGVLKLGS